MKNNPQPNAAITVAWITGILGCLGLVISAIIGLGVPLLQKSSKEPIVVVVTANALQTTDVTLATPVSGNQPAQSNATCQQIKGKLPESPNEIRSQFGIPADKEISVFYEICQEAPNGFIVKESPSLITLQVPAGGCIDSYSGASFSDATVPEQQNGGRRAYSGSVKTTSLTYRIAGCELKP